MVVEHDQPLFRQLVGLPRKAACTFSISGVGARDVLLPPERTEADGARGLSCRNFFRGVANDAALPWRPALRTDWVRAIPELSAVRTDGRRLVEGCIFP